MRRESDTGFLRRTDGAAAVEFAFAAPVVLAMVALVVFAGIGFEINRKVTQVAATLTDLASLQTNIGASSPTYTYSQILGAASLVIAPYSSSSVSMTLSEIQTNGGANGTVVWSQASGGATALAIGSSYPVPANLSSSSYILVGTASYSYNPLNLFEQTSPISLGSTIYMAPRASSSVSCCS
jgi:Flp pilus assembly protein TadG